MNKYQGTLFEGRTLMWFSCGAASAIAAKIIASEKLEYEIIYCDTRSNEHPDNTRFMNDISAWIGREIKILKSSKYNDIFDVFDSTGWLVGPGGARCTTELKKQVRIEYQFPDDTHVFGLTADAKDIKRQERMKRDHCDMRTRFPLIERGITKADCFRQLMQAGIELPAMYRLGFNNNNCIGCVKGGVGYWNKIKIVFPDQFLKMAAQERKMNVAICKIKRNGIWKHVFLDELPPDAGNYESELDDMECGPQCEVSNS